jgi:hypothetical protein
LFACINGGLNGGETIWSSIELSNFFGEMLKNLKLNCASVFRQVTGIAQTISELRHFLPGPPEERPSLVGEAIADYDPRRKCKDSITASRIAGFGKWEGV